MGRYEFQIGQRASSETLKLISSHLLSNSSGIGAAADLSSKRLIRFMQVFITCWWQLMSEWQTLKLVYVPVDPAEESTWLLSDVGTDFSGLMQDGEQPRCKDVSIKLLAGTNVMVRWRWEVVLDHGTDSRSQKMSCIISVQCSDFHWCSIIAFKWYSNVVTLTSAQSRNRVIVS